MENEQQQADSRGKLRQLMNYATNVWQRPIIKAWLRWRQAVEGDWRDEHFAADIAHMQRVHGQAVTMAQKMRVHVETIFKLLAAFGFMPTAVAAEMQTLQLLISAIVTNRIDRSKGGGGGGGGGGGREGPGGQWLPSPGSVHASPGSVRLAQEQAALHAQQAVAGAGSHHSRRPSPGGGNGEHQQFPYGDGLSTPSSSSARGGGGGMQQFGEDGQWHSAQGGAAGQPKTFADLRVDVNASPRYHHATGGATPHAAEAQPQHQPPPHQQQQYPQSAYPPSPTSTGAGGFTATAAAAAANGASTGAGGGEAAVRDQFGQLPSYPHPHRPLVYTQPSHEGVGEDIHYRVPPRGALSVGGYRSRDALARPASPPPRAAHSARGCGGDRSGFGGERERGRGGYSERGTPTSREMPKERHHLSQEVPEPRTRAPMRARAHLSRSPPRLSEREREMRPPSQGLSQGHSRASLLDDGDDLWQQQHQPARTPKGATVGDVMGISSSGGTRVLDDQGDVIRRSSVGGVELNYLQVL
jgi:hypothetical protein